MRNRILLSGMLCVLFMGACGDNMELIPAAGVEVEVNVNLNTTPYQSTKAGYKDPSAYESVGVENVWVLQFDGTTDDSRMVRVNYYDNYSPSTPIKLMSSTQPNRIVFIANTNDPCFEFGKMQTLSDLYRFSFQLYNDTDAAGETVAGIKNMYMNGTLDAVITGGMNLAASLKRNSVKVDLTVTNSTADIDIQYVRICSVPEKECFYTDYALPESYPAGDVALMDFTTDWADGTDVSGGKRFTFYIPGHKCGNSLFDGVDRKGWAAPDDATSICVVGKYMDGTVEKSVLYRIYLGSDLNKDCNLLPGHCYSYTIAINGHGDYETDCRIENVNMQDFSGVELANSYIVNPPSVDGIWKHVRVPVKRVHDFWNENDGYERESLFALESNSNGWVVDILRSSYELIPGVNFMWVDSVGNDYNDCFEFAIKSTPTVPAGNFIIGIRRFTNHERTVADDVFLWSWHFWVTDYDPYQKSLYTPEFDGSGAESRYIYTVKGGNVHRYNSGEWSETGALKDEFMMDRYLGAASVTTAAGKGNLYYQFGRKDPFPDNSTRYNEFPGHERANIGSKTDAVIYSINHPNHFLTAWPNADTDSEGIRYDANNTNWLDKKVASNYYSKSIFDPCPPGWKVPNIDALRAMDGKYNVTNQWYQPVAGIEIKLPRVSYENSNGVWNASNINTWLWSCQRGANVYSAYNLNGVGVVQNMNPNFGFLVRCISYTSATP